MPERQPPDSEALADRRKDLGIILLGSPMKLLFINHQARTYCSELVNEDGNAAHGILPRVVTDLARVGFNNQSGQTVKDCEEFSLSRIVGTTNHFVVRAISMPLEAGHVANILIVIDRHYRREGGISQKAKERFQLTPREIDVAEHLAKGWTNKEIANAIGVTEQTVKEHIKHIMEKTQTSTRTGVLVQILEL